jgi:hypothetical protein
MLSASALVAWAADADNGRSVHAAAKRAMRASLIILISLGFDYWYQLNWPR